MHVSTVREAKIHDFGSADLQDLTLIIIAPLGAFAWMRQKKSVRPCVCPEKQRVLSRSFSTGHTLSFRGKYSTSGSARFW